ncbi:MAG: hypothetical protein COB35_04295 [Gammaproteobacteria bacterium]|nr:MAG: hypothetical protein COB35_04295 [Gammaproteobacteria bacterium]
MLCKYQLILIAKLLTLTILLLIPIRQSHATLITFINEIHYDNAGTDQNEFIELAAIADTSLDGWTLALYNGNNGKVYKNISLNGFTFSDQINGFGFITVNFARNGIQNGAADGIALANAANQLIQFISYEGTLTALNGIAQGFTSNDIGVSELTTTPIGFSLQLGGAGNNYEDFIWQAAQVNSAGLLNKQQSFISLNSNSSLNNKSAQQVSQVAEPSNITLLLTSLCLLLLFKSRKVLVFKKTQ